MTSELVKSSITNKLIGQLLSQDEINEAIEQGKQNAQVVLQANNKELRKGATDIAVKIPGMQAVISKQQKVLVQTTSDLIITKRQLDDCQNELEEIKEIIKEEEVENPNIKRKFTEMAEMSKSLTVQHKSDIEMNEIEQMIKEAAKKVNNKNK